MEIVLFALRILMALALLGFVGAVLMLLIHENRATVRASKATPVAAPVPVTLTLLNRVGQPVRLFKVERNAWIGRDPNSLVYIDDTLVSARHAQLVWDEAAAMWFVEDNASRNGTFVNHVRVQRSPLQPEDALRVGGVQMRFQLAPLEVATSLPPAKRAETPA